MNTSNLVHTLYSRIKYRRISSLLQTVQLLLTNWSIQYHTTHDAEGYARSQHAVYNRNPVFMDNQKSRVNVGFLLHIVNFFIPHLAQQDQCTLFGAFENLEYDEKPQAWQEQLKQGTKAIGQSWIGMDGKDYYRL